MALKEKLKNAPILRYFSAEEVSAKALLRTAVGKIVVFSLLSEFYESKIVIYCKKHRFWPKIDNFAPQNRPENAKKIQILRNCEFQNLFLAPSGKRFTGMQIL